MLERALIFSVTLAVLLGSPSAAQAPPQFETEVWTMERLDLEVEIIPSAQKIRVQGRTLLRLEDASSDGPAFALNSRKKAMRFRRLTANGVNARIFDYKPEIEAAVLRMPRTFQRGDRLEVDYSLESEMESSQLVISQSVAFASWVENWYPIPATIEHGTASPAAPGSMTFRMPQGWRAVSNGALTLPFAKGRGWCRDGKATWR